MQPLDFSPISNAPLQAMQAAAYGDAMQTNRLQNRIAQMAFDEDQRKKSVAGLVAESLYGQRQPTNQLAAPAPAAAPQQQPSGMDPLVAFQRQGDPQAATLYGEMAQVSGATNQLSTPAAQQPTNQFATPADPSGGMNPVSFPGSPATKTGKGATAAATDYTEQRVRLRDLYNSGQITAQDAHTYDQQITAAETAQRATRTEPKIAMYKELAGKLVAEGNNEGFQALFKQAQSDPDVKGMLPDIGDITITGKQQMDVTRQFTATELAGLASKHPELGITPDTPPGLYKITMKGGKPVGWEPKDQTLPKGPDTAYFNGLMDNLKTAHPDWSPKQVEFEAGKEWDKILAARSNQRTKFTFDLKGTGGSTEADGFRSYTPEMKEQAFKDRQLGTYKYPTGMKSLSEKQAFDKDYYAWRVNGKIGANDVTTDRATAAANKSALTDLTKREQLIGSFTNRIDATSGVVLDAYKRLGNTDSRLQNIPINKLKQYMGSGDLRALNLAVTSLSNEVAKVESGSLGIAQVSEGQAQQMRKIHDLDTLSLNDVVKIIDMGKELGRTSRESIKIQREDLVKEMRGAGKETAPAAVPVRIGQAASRIASDLRGRWTDTGRQQQVYQNLKKQGYSDPEIGQAFARAKGL